MNKEILLWAEEQGLLDNNTPQLHMLHLQRRVGDLSAAIAFNEPEGIKQHIAEVMIHLTIVSELAGLDLNDTVELGFYKDSGLDVSEAQLIAALQDANGYYKRIISTITTNNIKLKDHVRKLEARTIYMKD